MGHKEWETDDFLDEFLDFDYRKPVPDRAGGKRSKGLPAGEVKKPKQENKSYGLGSDFDTYKAYEALRHTDNENAGKHASAEAGAQDLRSSGAFKPEIMEPLSAKRAGRPAERKVEPAAPALNTRKAAESSAMAAPVKESVKQKKKVSADAAESAEPAPAAKGMKDRLVGKHKHVRASELANEALGAAKKLVTSDEDTPPEVIPPAAAASMSDIDNLTSSRGKQNKRRVEPEKKPAEEKDELAELFAELEETGAKPLTKEDNAALRQAQEDAYDRYRGNYMKGVRKQLNAGKVGPFPKWLSRIYVLLLLHSWE